jgi:hypothetical protein
MQRNTKWTVYFEGSSSYQEVNEVDRPREGIPTGRYELVTERVIKGNFPCYTTAIDPEKALDEIVERIAVSEDYAEPEPSAYINIMLDNHPEFYLDVDSNEHMNDLDKNLKLDPGQKAKKKSDHMD